jgi:acyl carrier protein
MARDPKQEAADLIKSGSAQRVADNKFGKRVRNVDQDPMDVNDEFTAATLWDYAVKYHKQLGAGLATLECVRSALLQLKPQDVEYCFESGVVNEDDITMDTSFTEDIGADSLDLVELVMAFEDHYEAEINDDDLEKVRTIGDIVALVETL